MCSLAPSWAPRQLLEMAPAQARGRKAGGGGAPASVPGAPRDLEAKREHAETAEGRQELRFAMTVTHLCFKTLGLKDLLGNLF